MDPHLSVSRVEKLTKNVENVLFSPILLNKWTN